MSYSPSERFDRTAFGELLTIDATVIGAGTVEATVALTWQEDI